LVIGNNNNDDSDSTRFRKYSKSTRCDESSKSTFVGSCTMWTCQSEENNWRLQDWNLRVSVDGVNRIQYQKSISLFWNDHLFPLYSHRSSLRHITSSG